MTDARIMRLCFFIAIGVLLCGCDQRKPAMTDAQISELKKAAPYLTDDCLKQIRMGGIESIGSDQDCAQRLPPQRWTGLWRDDFESPLFCPAPAKECRNSRAGGIYLDFSKWRRPATLRDVPPGGLYAVDFVGRRTARGSPYLGAEADIVVDRMISIRQMEAPPPEPTKEQIIARFKKCEAERTCDPDWEAINALTE